MGKSLEWAHFALNQYGVSKLPPGGLFAAMFFVKPVGKGKSINTS